ncbi:unnamed protein product [Ilex paraguariensis]|uniref:Uncharacterized protein n=1 Tax=Ilex paraguariensis TaxID=185542 RepID=A0ABC8T8R4_9AQUA
MILPPANFDDLTDDINVETKIFLTVNRSLPSVRNVLKQLTATIRLVALVADLFSTDAFDIAKEFKVSPFLFFPSTAMAKLLGFYLPKLGETVSCKYRDMPEPVQLPGCVPIHGRDLMDPVKNRKIDSYKWVLHHVKRNKLAEGIILNSFNGVEPGAIKALQEEEPGKPPVYPIGPLIQMGSSRESDGSGCLSWLDDQPSDSVLFISFGSGGTLSYDQLQELALGIEMMGRLEIAKVVKGLMEGEEGKGLRNRMRDLKDAAAKALSEEGSSTKALAELACKWKNKIST